MQYAGVSGSPDLTLKTSPALHPAEVRRNVLSRVARLEPCAPIWGRLGWFVIAVAVMAMSPSAAIGNERPGSGRAPADGFGYAPGWEVCIGDACADTLDVSWQEVLPVAAAALTDDEWRVQSTDRIEGRILTEWQPVRHRLVHLFFGQVRERCVVDVTPLGSERCVVLFRAALATRESIGGNPLFPSVRKAYLKAVRDWQREVREALENRRRAGEATAIEPIGSD